MTPTSRIRKFVRQIAGIGDPPRYEVVPSTRGLIIKLNGKELLSSSVLDREFFEGSTSSYTTYTPSEVAVLEELERVVQKQSFGKTRTYSGLPEYSHIEGVVEMAWQNYRAAGTLPHFRSIVVHIGHDYIENIPELGKKTDEWETLLHKEDRMPDEDLRIEELEREMKILRYAAKGWLTMKLKNSIPESTSADEKASLEKKIDQSVNSIFRMTRSTESDHYSVSIGHVYRRRGNEDFAAMIMRMIGKNDDRTRNCMEYGPTYDADTTKQINLALNKDITLFKDTTVSGELTSRFGEVTVDGKMMDPPVMVMTAFNSMLALHYQNAAISRYAGRIMNNPDGRAAKLLDVLEISRQKMINSAIKLLEMAISPYETLHPDEKAKMGRTVERERKKGFYDGIEPRGPWEYWAGLDPKGREKVADLYETEAGQKRVYREARHFIEAFKNFRMAVEEGPKGSPRKLVDYLGDPTKQTLFTLKGVDKAMKHLGNYRRAKEII